MKHKEGMEDDPHAFVNDVVTSDAVFRVASHPLGWRADIFDLLDALEREPQSYWQDLIRRYLLDAPVAELVMEPSTELADQIQRDREAAEARTRSELGADGLAEKSRVLRDAVERNSRPVPPSFAYPDVPSADTVPLLHLASQVRGGVALRCVALRCVARRCVAFRCVARRCVARRCAALRCAALRCAALRGVLTCVQPPAHHDALGMLVQRVVTHTSFVHVRMLVQLGELPAHLRPYAAARARPARSTADVARGARFLTLFMSLHLDTAVQVPGAPALTYQEAVNRMNAEVRM